MVVEYKVSRGERRDASTLILKEFFLHQEHFDRFEPVKSILRLAKERGFRPQDFKELQANNQLRKSFEEYEGHLVRLHAFNELAELLAQTGREFPCDPTRADEVVKKLRDAGLTLDARNCMRAMEASGISLDTQLKEDLEQQARLEEVRRERRVPREIEQREIPKSIEFLVPIFYVEARILQFGKIVREDAAHANIELPFSIVLPWRELESALRQDMGTMRQMLLVRLLDAVDGEVFSRDVFLPADHDFPAHEESPGQHCFRYATQEEMLGYFYQAEQRFKDPDWPEDYGGEKWAMIAQAGVDLLLNLRPIDCIDRVLQLEHRTASILRGGALDTVALKHFFSAHANTAGNTQDILEASRLIVNGGNEVFERLQHLIERWRDLLTKIEKCFVAHNIPWNKQKWL